MSTSESKLFSLLFGGEVKLDNIKFFPGEKCVSSEELFDAAFDAISDVLSGKTEIALPSLGAKKVSFGDLLASI